MREGIPDERIFVTGNTGIDALRYAAELDVPYEDDAVAAVVELGLSRYVVVTAHRRENWDGGLARIAEAVGRLAASRIRGVASSCRCIRTRSCAQSSVSRSPDRANVVLTEPLAYAQFARLMAGAALIVTDSGGIQEEAPALGVPVLVARDSTERGEGVAAGTLTLVGTDPDRIVAAADGGARRPGGAHRRPRQPTRTATVAPPSASSPRSSTSPASARAGALRASASRARRCSRRPAIRSGCSRRRSRSAGVAARPQRGERPLGGTLIALTMPFEDLPAWAQVLFYVAFALIVAVLGWTTVLFVALAHGAALARPRRTRRPRTDSCGCSSSRR